MRVIFLLSSAMVIILNGCIETGHFKMEIVNKSESVLCVWLWREGREECVITPSDRYSLSSECDSFGKIVPIGLTTPEGQQIYRREATCREWDGDRIIVEQRRGEFVVVDTLGNQ